MVGEGQAIPSAHGFVGTRAMPAKGGEKNMTLPDFSAALAYMANKSGADWQTKPDDKMLKEIADEVEVRSNRNIKQLNAIKEETKKYRK